MPAQQNKRPSQNPTISSTAQGLTDMGFTSEEANNATRAWITGSGGDLRYMTNGETPTATFGHIIKDEITTQQNEAVAQLKLIRQSVDVTVTIELDTRTAS